MRRFTVHYGYPMLLSLLIVACGANNPFKRGEYGATDPQSGGGLNQAYFEKYVLPVLDSSKCTLCHANKTPSFEATIALLGMVVLSDLDNSRLYQVATGLGHSAKLAAGSQELLHIKNWILGATLESTPPPPPPPAETLDREFFEDGAKLLDVLNNDVFDGASFNGCSGCHKDIGLESIDGNWTYDKVLALGETPSAAAFKLYLKATGGHTLSTYAWEEDSEELENLKKWILGDTK